MTNPSEIILVVDDNPGTRYSTSRVLRSAGLQVVEVATGLEAIAKAVEGASLVVLDINLPDIDGFQVCRELRALAQTRRTPVIYLSATFVDDMDKVHGVNAGADGYLTHPIEPPVLIATVNAFLRAQRAEDALLQSEAKFKAVFENALDGIALLSDELLLLDVNPAMCRILGRDRTAVVGRHISAFSPKEHPIARPAMTTALASSGAWRGTSPVLNADGAQVELEWSVSIYSEPDIRLAILSDITERKAIEVERERLLVSERVARAEAEQANRLKDDFLAALSHELRTPLNAIMGFSHLLQLSPLAADPQIAASITAIERNARVQARLVSDLLDISRIAAGKLQLDRQSLNPAEVLRSALASIQSAAAAKGIAMEVEVDPVIEAICWDAARFQQVVWNLVDNAIKFSAVGGAVHVRLKQLPSSVDLVVQDNGRGIAPDFLPHVFDRFRQEDASSKRWHGGLGLGLAVVQQIVTAHGATIAVESEGEGRGARFLVRIPRTPVHDSSTVASALAAQPPDLRDIRVLVVEDNDDARALIRGELTRASAHVMDFSDVASALRALRSFSPDVLVSDLGMPDQDGYDLIRAVRAQGLSSDHLPAIAVTAFARDTDERRVLDAGYQSHFVKPIDVPRLLGEVRRLADQKRGR